MLASALLSESRLARRAKEKVRILDDIPIARRTFNCSAGFCDFDSPFIILLVLLFVLFFNHLLGVGLKDVGKAMVLRCNEMADEGEGVLQLSYDGIFIVLMGQVIAGGDVGTTHADAIECQGEDVAALAGSDCKLTIDN